VAKQIGARTEPKSWRIARVLLMIPLVPLVLGVFGFIGTAALNNTFGRTGPFGWESPQAYVLWGLRSIVAPLFWAVVTTLVVSAARFVVRVLTVSSLIDRIVTRFTTWVRRAASALGLDDLVVLTQALAMLAVVAIAVVCCRYSALIVAWAGSFVNISDAARLVPLQTTNGDRGWYRIVLAVLTLAFGVGLFQVMQRRRRHNIRHGRGGLIALVAVIGVMVLMNELPYRIFRTESERLDLAGMRCYEIGQTADDLLIYCPDTSPPRNHVIKRTDPAIRRTGVVENIFTPKP